VHNRRRIGLGNPAAAANSGLECGGVRSPHSRGFLSESVWRERLDYLADALLGYVQPDGGVVISHDHTIADIRGTLFALQALYLTALRSACEPAPTVAFQLLV
jgi:hypothetical protein